MMDNYRDTLTDSSGVHCVVMELVTMKLMYCVQHLDLVLTHLFIIAHTAQLYLL